MPAHSEHPEADSSNAVWYLGIDFSTTGVSAVLLNQATAQQYPIYWSKELGVTSNKSRTVNSQSATGSIGEAIVRLPSVTYSGSSENELFVQLPGTSVVGSLVSTSANNQLEIFLQNFKPYLNVSIPYYCPKRHEWQPILHLPGQQLVSIYGVRQALQVLLETLTPKSTLPDSLSAVGAVGLEPETLQRALQQLEGVVLGCPALWGDTYQFNLREAVLEAKLVKHPEQIFFLEDAIAGILAALPRPSADPLKGESKGEEENYLPTSGSNQSSPNLLTKAPVTPSPPHLLTPSTSSWQGGTLSINAGATTTELALVDLPDDLQSLTYSDFSLCSLPYAGNAIDQDIFCQLLYPQLSLVQRQQLSLSSDLELPQSGQPDKPKRDRLVSLLQSSPLGRSLLKASGYLKLILQRKDEFTLDLDTERWVLKRIDLETKVVLPFIQQLNRELNALLIATGISEQGVYQILCIGGTATFETLHKWLQQKLPNATLIQDSDSPNGSWVATGLATLPLYPQVFDRLQQQYSDYFLLLELLRAFPTTEADLAQQPYNLGEIMQKLERRGLNTGACYERLVRLVEGQLPAGLIPSNDDANWLSQRSNQNLYDSTITTQPLFFQESNQLYRLNPEKHHSLSQYLDLILAGTYQKFEEPLIVKLGTKNW